MGNYQYHIFSPYRVCPLGAHVDHQHGLVTGFAFNMGVDLWFNPVEDGRVSLKSLTFEGSVDFDVTKPTQVKEGNWGDYARGAKYALSELLRASLAPQVGLEPTTYRLTAGCSTIELSRHLNEFIILQINLVVNYFFKTCQNNLIFLLFI